MSLGGLILRTITEESPVALAVLNPEGRYEIVSKTHSVLTGLPDEVFLRRCVGDVYKSGYFVYEPIAQKALVQGAPAMGIQRLSTGKEVMVSSIPLAGEGEKVSGVVTLVFDLREVLKLVACPESDVVSEARITGRVAPNGRRDSGGVDIIAHSPAMVEVLETVYKIAPTDANVLILGETGVGKEVIAEAIHRASGRKGELVKITCTALPRDTIEAELFGYEKGAFTGALPSGKPGLLELAQGGTILLDEIGDLPVELQGKLLRAVEERKFYRVGGTKPVSVQARFLAATNRNLEEAVARGSFRSDLFYRLNTVCIYIPPLRCRREDIPPLCASYLARFNREYGRQRQLSTGAVRLLQAYHWPGNVRELINLMERLVITGKQDVITPEEVSKHLGLTYGASACSLPHKMVTLKEAIRQLEMDYIREAYSTAKSSRELARILGISHTAVLKKLRRYGFLRDRDVT